MKYAYPAIFSPDDGSIDVIVPDLPGCVTCGESVIDAIEMVRDAISMWLCDAEGKNKNIPSPSAIYDHQTPVGGFVNPVDIDTDKYRHENY